MLIAIGSARASSGRRDELVAAAREVVRHSRVEDGCLSYGFFADLDDEDSVVSLEIWRDQNALDDHMTRPHTQAFLAQVTELVIGTPTVVVHAVPDTTEQAVSTRRSP